MRITASLTALLVLLAGYTTMVNADDEVFLDSKHSASGRFAILEEQNGTAWLYLTAPDKPRPEMDVVVFVRSRLATMDEVRAAAKKGQPPPLAKDFASKHAILPKPKVADFSLKWSADGQSVTVLRNNSPLAMILADAKRGFSKALSKSGPFGEPWDQAAYERVFGTQGGTMAEIDSIRITCPNGHRLRVKPALAGKRVRCPNKSCGAVVDVPSAETSDEPEPESRSINYLFPADEINNLPTWRFVLHFVAPIAFEPAMLERAIAQLKATDWKIVTFPNGLDSLSLSEESDAVGVPVEVSEKRRRRPNSLADYESDFWKINFNMIDCGFGDLYYEAVDWKE